MKLGTQTGSLTNHILSRATIGQPVPVVGMGATILCWTDRKPATIVAVDARKSGTIVTVQEDVAKRADENGLSEDQTYTFTANPNARKITFRQAKGGGWQEVTFNAATKRWNAVEGHGLRIGERDKYHDFSF